MTKATRTIVKTVVNAVAALIAIAIAIEAFVSTLAFITMGYGFLATLTLIIAFSTFFIAILTAGDAFGVNTRKPITRFFAAICRPFTKTRV